MGVPARELQKSGTTKCLEQANSMKKKKKKKKKKTVMALDTWPYESFANIVKHHYFVSIRWSMYLTETAK